MEFQLPPWNKFFLEVCSKYSSTKDEEDELMEKMKNSSLLESKEVDNFHLNDVRIKDRKKLFFIHFWALIKKRLQYFKRDKRGLACEIFIPCIMLIFGLYMLTMPGSYEQKSYWLDTDKLYDYTPNNFYGSSSDISTSNLENLMQNFNKNYDFKKYSENENSLKNFD